MDQLAHYAQQLAEMFRQHAPADATMPAMPAAIVALVFGVGICVLGAKLARWLITVVFAVGGLLAGLSLGGHVDAAPMITALLGASALGVVGYMMHRLWVGVFTGAFLATVAFGVLSTQMILPHLDGFAKQQEVAAQQEVTTFTPGPVSDAMHAGWDRFWDYTHQFGEYLVANQPDIQKYSIGVVVIAGAFGLLMGVFLCRLTLILFTAAFGTSLIGAGMAMFGQEVHVDMLKMLQERPEMSALALGAFFIFSIILQTMLTRSAPAAPAKKAE